MRTLRKNEISKVVGGLRLQNNIVMTERTGRMLTERNDRTLTERTDTTSGQLKISGLGPYEKASSLFNTELNDALAQGFTIEYGNDPESGGSSFDQSGHLILIGTASEGNMADTVGQLAHELGHFYSQDVQDTMLSENPFDYSSQTDYINAQMTNEGYAQLNAINVLNQITSGNLQMNLPGLSQSVTEQEISTVDSMEAAHDSSSSIAQDLGQILVNTDITSGETYHTFYTTAYAHAVGGGGMLNDLDYAGGQQQNFMSYIPVSDFYNPGWTEVGTVFVGPLEPM